MGEIREEIFRLFNHVEQNKCLCSFVCDINIKEMWQNIYRCCFESKDSFKEEDYPILCISFIRVVGEIYTDSTLTNQSICISIQELLELFSSDDLWNLFIYHIKNCKNKYLLWTFIKSFCIILYTCDASIFCQRINGLLDDLEKGLFEETKMNILDFFSVLIDYNIKSSLCGSPKISCDCVVQATAIPFKDLFQSLCRLLSLFWPSFMKQFQDAIVSEDESQRINKFLILWQKLVEKCPEQDVYNKVLTEEFVTAFLLYAHKLNVISLRIYADVIMQFFIANRKSISLEKSCDRSVEETLIMAINNNFFSLLPQDYQLTGFCIKTNLNHTESASYSDYEKDKKCDPVIVKKVAFIFWSLLADLKNKQLIISSISKVSDFVMKNFDIFPDTDIHVWIPEVFIDQDDILLGVIFALLKNYLVLEEDFKKFPEGMKLRNSLNPHRIFISFLQKLGFDHNELLSFLMSDETCFLPYLTQYLKLLLREWDIFMQAHSKLIEDDEDTFKVDKSFKDNEEKLNIPPAKKLLVSYSSSSSEEDISSANSALGKNDDSSHEINLIVIRTFIKLKSAIEKLVKAKEFPYNVLPLISLLKDCEERYLKS